MDRPFSDYLIFADESGDHGLETFEASYPVFVLVFFWFARITICRASSRRSSN